MTEVVKPQCIASGICVQSSNVGRLRGRLQVRRGPLAAPRSPHSPRPLRNDRRASWLSVMPLVLKLQNPQKGTALLAGANTVPARHFAQRCGAYLALMALMLQLALSFAHVHKHSLASSGFDRADIASIGYDRSALQAIEKLPSRLADDEDRCQICFSSFLVSNSSLPAAPAHPRSLQFAEIDRALNPVSDRIFQQRRAAFLSRAPPVS